MPRRSCFYILCTKWLECKWKLCCQDVAELQHLVQVLATGGLKSLFFCRFGVFFEDDVVVFKRGQDDLLL